MKENPGNHVFNNQNIGVLCSTEHLQSWSLKLRLSLTQTDRPINVNAILDNIVSLSFIH